MLERAARDHGFAVTIDGHVDARCAAMLVGRSAGTLRNWRCGKSPLRFRRLGGRRGRVGYSLHAIAQFLLDADSDAERECTETHEASRSEIDSPSAVTDDAAQAAPRLKAAS
jgi:hypothetical protein